MAIADKLELVAQNQELVYEAGKQTAYDEFWDAYQQKGNRKNYQYAFSGVGWTAEILKPKYSIQELDSSNYMFAYNTEIIDISHLPKMISKYGCGYMFYKASKLKHIGEIEIAANSLMLDYFFAEASALETVDLLKVASNTRYTETFRNCTSLTNITFDGVIGYSISFAACSKLTAVSVDSIIEHLADLTGKTAQKLTLHADAKAKLTEEQTAAIAAKNWNLA